MDIGRFLADMWEQISAGAAVWWGWISGGWIWTLLIVPALLALRALFFKSAKIPGEYLLNGLLFGVTQHFNQRVAARFSLKAYAHLQLKGSSRYMPVPSRGNIKLEIDRMFVPLYMEEQAGASATTITHQNLLQLGNRLLVIGEPGSGKSTLVKRVFRDECLKATRHPSKATFPIRIELNDLKIPDEPSENVDWGIWLLEYVKKSVLPSSAYQLEKCFDIYGSNKGLLLLFDGLDEVATSKFPRVWEALNSLARHLEHLSEHNTVLITMRVQFYDQLRERYTLPFPKTVFLKPFSPNDIYEFLTRWEFTPHHNISVASVFGALSDRPTLRDMCRNPLVLAMYVAEVQEQGHALAPETRTSFYTTVTEELILKRRLGQTGAVRSKDTLKSQREQILGRLAFDNITDMKQAANSLSLETAIATIINVTGCKPEDATGIFDELATDTGLVAVEKPGETFRFIHLTFLEFLAALEAVQGKLDGWEQLLVKHKRFSSQPEPQSRTRLLEVIPFAAGLLPRVQRIGAMTNLIDLEDWQLTARGFLETKNYDHPRWPEFALDLRNILVNTHEEKWDAEWLRGVHLFNVLMQDAEDSARHVATGATGVDLEQFYRQLVEKQQHSLATLMSSYAQQDAIAAFRLAQITHLDLPTAFPEVIIFNCDQRSFLGVVLDTARLDMWRAELWATILAESALRFQSVTVQLQSIDPMECFNLQGSNPGKRNAWSASPLLKPSVYSQILSIAASTNIVGTELWAMVSHLRECSPPPRDRASFWLAKAFGFLSQLELGIELRRIYTLLIASLATLTAISVVQGLLDSSYWVLPAMLVIAAFTTVVPFWGRSRLNLVRLYFDLFFASLPKLEISANINDRLLRSSKFAPLLRVLHQRDNLARGSFEVLPMTGTYMDRLRHYVPRESLDDFDIAVAQLNLWLRSAPFDFKQHTEQIVFVAEELRVQHPLISDLALFALAFTRATLERERRLHAITSDGFASDGILG